MNKVSVRFFAVGEKPFTEYEEFVENPENVLDVAYGVAFDTVGHGLADWDFVERSFNKATKQLSEIYRYNTQTGYYQLLIKKFII